MKKKRVLADFQEMDSIRLTIRGFIIVILFFAVLFGLGGCGGGESSAYWSLPYMGDAVM